MHGLVLPIVIKSRTFTRHDDNALLTQADLAAEHSGPRECKLSRKLCNGGPCCRVDFGSEIGGMHTLTALYETTKGICIPAGVPERSIASCYIILHEAGDLV